MYTKIIISLLILSHIFNDFYIQNDEMSVTKRRNLKILWKHSLLFFVSALIITIPFICIYLIFYIFIITISHFFIDYLKICCDKSFKKVPSIIFFIIGQVLHIMFIFAMSPSFRSISLNYMGQRAATWLYELYPELGTIAGADIVYAILFVSCILFLINGGTVAVKLVLKLPKQLIYGQAVKSNKSMKGTAAKLRSIPQKTAQEMAAANQTCSHKAEFSNLDKSQYKYGEVIGILERIIIFLLIISGHYESIAFVIAAKSIARFKQFETNDFSDYYLVGTLSSSLIAIICACIFKYGIII